jgi:hypothetical protein
MPRDRTTLTESTQIDVIKRSRRRCCVCYGLNRDLQTKRGQIAHLDQNRNNSELENLVFLCLEHHDEFDSKTSQSKGLRRSEVEAYRLELDKYFSSWDPKTENVTDFDLQQRVLLEISLNAHSWKNQYMTKYPGQFREGTFPRTRSYEDVWEMLLDVAHHPYSQESWRGYLNLFTGAMTELTDRFERIVMMHGGELPAAMKLAILEANSQLRVESGVYQALPQLIDSLGLHNPDDFFLDRFHSTIRILTKVSRLADELRVSR